MSRRNQKLDPDEILFTLDQLEQTTEIMGRVVSRLKRQLSQIQQAGTAHSAAQTPQPQNNASPPAKVRKTLH